MDGFDGWDWDGIGHHCHGWGFGWLIPALLVGKVISQVIEPEEKRTWPTPPPVVPPTPKSSQAPEPQPSPRPASQSGSALAHCRHCDRDIQKGFAYCPHCGRQVSPTNCQYCGHKLLAEAAYCGHCGGPAR
jgi:hypothetical protein